MAVRKNDVAARKDIVAQLSQKKRKEALERDENSINGKMRKEQEHRWKPLVMANTSVFPYLCHCRDVKRGFANVCPAHMLTFHLGQSVH